MIVDRMWCEYNKLLNKYNKYNNKNKLKKVMRLLWIFIGRSVDEFKKIELIDEVIKMINGDKRKIMRKEIKREDCCEMENRLVDELIEIGEDDMYISVFDEEMNRYINNIIENKKKFDNGYNDICCKLNILSAPRLECIYNINWDEISDDEEIMFENIIREGKGYVMRKYYYDNIYYESYSMMDSYNYLGNYIINNCKSFGVFELVGNVDKNWKNDELRRMLGCIVREIERRGVMLDKNKYYKDMMKWVKYNDLINKFNDVYKDYKMVGMINYDGKILGVCECGMKDELIDLKNGLGIKYELKYEEFKYE